MHRIRSAALLVGLTGACVSGPTLSPNSPGRLAVAEVMTCLACADGPRCVAHVEEAPVIRVSLPGAEGLKWDRLRRFAAGPDRVCALLEFDLHCWDYSYARGEFSALAVESKVADFDLENGAQCWVSRGGSLRCTGRSWARAEPSVGADGMVALGAMHEVDVDWVEARARVERVALHELGGCRSDARGGLSCWAWGDSIEPVELPSTQISALWRVRAGIEVWTDSGVFLVEFDDSRPGSPRHAVEHEPEEPPRAWIHCGGFACRRIDEGAITCMKTRNLGSFDSAPRPPGPTCDPGPEDPGS